MPAFTVTKADIRPGTRFDTQFETNCLVVTEPDETTGFDAYDSDGILCMFSVEMVTNIWEPRK